VVEVANPDPYGSEADLGLVPGGRVKLVKSTSIGVTSQPTRRGPERYLTAHDLPLWYNACTYMYTCNVHMYMCVLLNNKN
jgi:hypothetical protein